jgi:3-oxoacyl-[acyl-carrier protein] reductase
MADLPLTTSRGATSLPLANKVAIVTGASRGIGAGIAFELGRLGANVTFSEDIRYIIYH